VVLTPFWVGEEKDSFNDITSDARPPTAYPLFSGVLFGRDFYSLRVAFAKLCQGQAQEDSHFFSYPSKFLYVDPMVGCLVTTRAENPRL